MIEVKYKRKGQKERSVLFEKDKLGKEDAKHYAQVLKDHLKSDLEKIEIKDNV